MGYTREVDQFPRNNLKFLVISADPVIKTLKTNQKLKTFSMLIKLILIYSLFLC